MIAPALERMIRIAGNREPVRKITMRGLALQATTTPLKPAGFGAGAFDGALRVELARQCVLEKLEIAMSAARASAGEQMAVPHWRLPHPSHRSLRHPNRRLRHA